MSGRTRAVRAHRAAQGTRYASHTPLSCRGHWGRQAVSTATRWYLAEPAPWFRSGSRAQTWEPALSVISRALPAKAKCSCWNKGTASPPWAPRAPQHQFMGRMETRLRDPSGRTPTTWVWTSTARCVHLGESAVYAAQLHATRRRAPATMQVMGPRAALSTRSPCVLSLVAASRDSWHPSMLCSQCRASLRNTSFFPPWERPHSHKCLNCEQPGGMARARVLLMAHFRSTACSKFYLPAWHAFADGTIWNWSDS